MSTKNLFLTLGRILLLVVVYLILEMVTGAIITVDLPPIPQEQMPAVFLGLFLVAVVDSLIVALVISRSRWYGWKLMLGLGVALFGVMAVMTQIETIYFTPALEVNPMVGWVVLLQSLIRMVVFVPLAVLIFGKIRGDSSEESSETMNLPAIQWIWKLALISVVYVILYLSFGYIVAWQNPALRTMYGEGANQAVFNPLQLVALQLVRGILWALFVYPVIRLLRAKSWGGAVVLGLFISLPATIVLAIPNSIMPDPTVRLSHFIETTSSNFLFGMVIYWLLHRSHVSVSDLFRSRGDSSTGRTSMKMAGD